MCGIEISDLPYLASGHILNLTYEYMADLRIQCIAANDNNEISPEKNPVPKTIPLTQLEKENNCISEKIICLSQSKHIHNPNAAFKHYSREELMKMTKLDLFLPIFPVNYLKEILIPKTNNLLKNPMDLEEFIQCMGCWFYMGCWVGIPNSRNWW